MVFITLCKRRVGKIRYIKARVRKIHIPAGFYGKRSEPKFNDELFDNRRNILKCQIKIGVLDNGIVPRARHLVNQVGVFLIVLAFRPNTERRALLGGNAPARGRNLFAAVGKSDNQRAAGLKIRNIHAIGSLQVILFILPQNTENRNLFVTQF